MNILSLNPWRVKRFTKQACRENVVASLFPLKIFIPLCFNVLSTVSRENRPADSLYLYIYICGFVYVYIYIYIYIHRHVFKNPAIHLLFSHQKCLFLTRNKKKIKRYIQLKFVYFSTHIKFKFLVHLFGRLRLFKPFWKLVGVITMGMRFLLKFGTANR